MYIMPISLAYATAVTHVIGLRPFMSQLLCEQTVGRGRRSQELPEQTSHRV
jgi:hypothetical protein